MYELSFYRADSVVRAGDFTTSDAIFISNIEFTVCFNIEDTELIRKFIWNIKDDFAFLFFLIDE